MMTNATLHEPPPHAPHLAHWRVVVYLDSNRLYRAQVVNTRTGVTYDVPGAKLDYIERIDTAWHFIEAVKWHAPESRAWSAKKLVKVAGIAA
jgi:hypothetical protein